MDKHIKQGMIQEPVPEGCDENHERSSKTGVTLVTGKTGTDH
jgi:hypothetical protein